MSAPTAEDFAKLPPRSTRMVWTAPNSGAKFWIAIVQPVNRIGGQLLEWQDDQWIAQPGTYTVAAMRAVGYRAL